MEAATMVERTEFANESGGVVGYVRINPKTGEEIGDFVRPGETVWLTDAEIEATHRAPRSAEGSPFAKQSYPLTEEVPEQDPADPEKTIVRTKTKMIEGAPLLTRKRRGQPPVFAVDEVAAPPADPSAPAPQGSFADGEEPGTQT